MNSKLRAAYQRLEAKRQAVNAITGKQDRFTPRFVQRVLFGGEDSRVERVPNGRAWLPQRHGHVGFREIGNVQAEPHQWRNRDFLTHEHCGWFTNNRGETMRDGEGLVCGVVLALPGWRRWGRFIAGYKFLGTDNGICVDLSKIFAGPVHGGNLAELMDTDVVRECARHADRLAENAADEERRYEDEQEIEDDDDA